MTTMAEPEWDADTRAMALAHDAVTICPLCGYPTSLCQDPELAHDWRAQDPIRCHVTTTRRTAQRGVTEQTNPVPDALLWPVTLARKV